VSGLTDPEEQNIFWEIAKIWELNQL